jgi:hypothetical protein
MAEDLLAVGIPLIGVMLVHKRTIRAIFVSLKAYRRAMDSARRGGRESKDQKYAWSFR